MLMNNQMIEPTATVLRKRGDPRRAKSKQISSAMSVVEVFGGK
jgi:hypothetical protein